MIQTGYSTREKPGCCSASSRLHCPFPLTPDPFSPLQWDREAFGFSIRLFAGIFAAVWSRKYPSRADWLFESRLLPPRRVRTMHGHAGALRKRKAYMSRPQGNSEKQGGNRYSDLYIGISFLLIIGISSFLFISVMPKFKEIFASFEGLELPFITRLMINPRFQVFYLFLMIITMAGYFLWKRRGMSKYAEMLFLALMGLAVAMIILTIFLPIMRLQSQLQQTG